MPAHDSAQDSVGTGGLRTTCYASSPPHSHAPNSIERDAKASVLCWDAATAGLVTSSLHYFEANEGLRGGRTAFSRGPLAAGDPLGRCGAVMIYDNKLAVLPAMVPELLELDEAEGVAGKLPDAGTVGNGYVDDLEVALGIKEVRRGGEVLLRPASWCDVHRAVLSMVMRSRGEPGEGGARPVGTCLAPYAATSAACMGCWRPAQRHA